MSNNYESQKDLRPISDQPEAAQIYEELSEEALASVAGGRYFITEGGVIAYNGEAPEDDRHIVTPGVIFGF